MSELDDVLHRQALAAQKFTRKFFVVELDFGPASLDELDGQFKTAGYALRGGLNAANTAQLVELWGAYLGEVIRHSAPGAAWIDGGGEGPDRWHVASGDVRIAPLAAIAARIAAGTPTLRAFHDDAVRRLAPSV